MTSPESSGERDVDVEVVESFLGRQPWFRALGVDTHRVVTNPNIKRIATEAMAAEAAQDRRIADLESKLNRVSRENDQLKLQLTEAHTDSMTGCLTKDGLKAALLRRDQEIVEHPPLGTLVAFIDGDGIKTLNDSLGHSVGDAGIAEIAKRVKQGLRTEDIIARLGGDEFAFVMDIREAKHGELPLDPVAAADHLRSRLSHIELNLDDRTIEIGASMGFDYIEGVPTSDEILRHIAVADEDMYEQKRSRKEKPSSWARLGRKAISLISGTTPKS